jgi:hypothetical protein
MPDQSVIDQSLDIMDWALHQPDARNYLPDDEYHFHSNAQIFTGMLYNHGHQMAYDFETISIILSKIGFVNINLGIWCESAFFEELTLLEGHDSQRRIESLIVECQK